MKYRMGPCFGSSAKNNILAGTEPPDTRVSDSVPEPKVRPDEGPSMAKLGVVTHPPVELMGGQRLYGSGCWRLQAACNGT